MLCNLALKNMKKSVGDYTIYFLTLVFGVAIFYMFNSMDSQQVMMTVSSSTRKIIQLLINTLSMLSVFIAVVLGLLIAYANHFLIGRRKKEFGIYMILGMPKRDVSRILLLETVMIGAVSLVIGLVVGIFGAQLMSVFTAHMFEVDMERFTFVISKAACLKTCVYFVVMYVAIVLFNAISVSRYQLIDLLNSAKKSERIVMKNPLLCVLLFLASVVDLGMAYWMVTGGLTEMREIRSIAIPIVMGCVGTVVFFWSLSGFLMRLFRATKGIYYRDANLFVLRQLNSKMNTNVMSISVICLMLFVTISALSSAIALRNSMQKSLDEGTPMDLNIEKYYGEEHTGKKNGVTQDLIALGFSMNLLKDVEEVPSYRDSSVTWETFFGDSLEDIKQQEPQVNYAMPERIVRVSDYNRIAAVYGEQTYSLKDNEYICLCDFASMRLLRDSLLADGHPLDIAGATYVSKYPTCQEGFLNMSVNHSNLGILLVPDSCALTEQMKASSLLVANYAANTQEQYESIDELFTDDAQVWTQLSLQGQESDRYLLMSKSDISAASVGVSTLGIFLALYLGIVFLIASAAILSLKQLTESSDNVQRYDILRKLGCGERMISAALFKQIGIFFAMPLLLAIVHSVFGIAFGLRLLEGLVDSKDLLPSILMTAVTIGAIYGVYFVATYVGSRRMISGRNSAWK